MPEFKDFLIGVVTYCSALYVAITVILSLANENLFGRKKSIGSPSFQMTFFFWYIDSIVALSAFFALPIFVSLFVMATGGRFEESALLLNLSVIGVESVSIVSLINFTRAMTAVSNKALWPFVTLRLLTLVCLLPDFDRLLSISKVDEDTIVKLDLRLSMAGTFLLISYLMAFGASKLYSPEKIKSK